jgi:hypothetical protein
MIDEFLFGKYKVFTVIAGVIILFSLGVLLWDCQVRNFLTIVQHLHLIPLSLL